MASSQRREVNRAARKKSGPQALGEKSLQAALLAVDRLTEMLKDPATSNADVLKAATLIFDRVYPAQASGGASGDYEICVKED